MQASEPGDVQKTKVTDKLVTSLWDRWEIEAHNCSLKETFQKFEEKYEGLEIRDVMRGNTPVYFYAIMNAAGKEKDKEKTLSSQVSELLFGN
jgi:hypothetical protein